MNYCGSREIIFVRYRFFQSSYAANRFGWSGRRCVFLQRDSAPRGRPNKRRQITQNQDGLLFQPTTITKQTSKPSTNKTNHNQKQTSKQSTKTTTNHEKVSFLSLPTLWQCGRQDRRFRSCRGMLRPINGRTQCTHNRHGCGETSARRQPWLQNLVPGVLATGAGGQRGASHDARTLHPIHLS